MATGIISDDGSCEKLLDDSEKCSQDEEENEEDCIELLLNSLERDANEVSENLAERKKKLLAEDREEETELKVYLKQKYGNSMDNLDDSVNGSVNDLNASLIKLNQTTSKATSGTRHTSSKREVSAAVLHRERLAMKLLKKHKSESGKVVCGIAIILIILGIGGSLLFLAYMLDMEDLYILGGIFSLGGIVFTIAFIIVRCQAIEQLEDTDYSVLYKA